MAAVRHLKNAGGPAGFGAAGQRKEMVSRCALLSSAVRLAALIVLRASPPAGN